MQDTGPARSQSRALPARSAAVRLRSDTGRGRAARHQWRVDHGIHAGGGGCRELARGHEQRDGQRRAEALRQAEGGAEGPLRPSARRLVSLAPDVCLLQTSLKIESYELTGNPDKDEGESASYSKAACGRANLRAAGWSESDFIKPVITVGLPYSNGLPCNNMIRELGDMICAAIERHGGKSIIAGLPSAYHDALHSWTRHRVEPS